MRKLAFFVVGGAIWLLVGAMPAYADTLPHMSTAGQLTDRCAGCHRLHSAQAAYVLVEEEPALCYTCHGPDAGGSALSVTDGVGYSDSTRTAGAGALRGGGFEYALLGSPVFNPYTPGAAAPNNGALVSIGVLTPATHEAATSTHSVDGTAYTAWGSGAAFVSTPPGNPGTAVNLECTSCHDPHGGNDGGAATYRILKNNPAGLTVSAEGVSMAANTLATVCVPSTSDPTGGGNVCTTTAGTGANINTVTCSADRSVRNGAGRVRVTCKSSIYPTTVGATINGGSSGGVPTYPADSLISSNMPVAPNIQAVTDVATKTYTTTDYWKGIAQDPAGSFTTAGFTGQMANWCAQCHTRYKATSGQTYNYNTGDAIFKYRHQGASTSSWTATGGSPGANCIQCHVSHGANTDTGDQSSTLQNPGGGTAGLGVGATPDPAHDNRLLRTDQRGVCMACHQK